MRLSTSSELCEHRNAATNKNFVRRGISKSKRPPAPLPVASRRTGHSPRPRANAAGLSGTVNPVCTFGCSRFGADDEPPSLALAHSSPFVDPFFEFNAAYSARGSGSGSPRARASSYGLTYCAHNGATVARSSCKFLHVAVNVLSMTPKNPLYSISSASEGRSFNKMYRNSSREYAGK